VAVGDRGVGVAGRRVGVAVGGRRVGVGGTGVKVGVSVTAGVGISVGVSVAVGAGVSTGVEVLVGVDVKKGFGVLVGVSVTVGAEATRDTRGQLQLKVAIIAVTTIPRTAVCFLFKSAVPVSCSTGHLPQQVPLSLLSSGWPGHYLEYSKTIFSICPIVSQPVNSMLNVSDTGTGLASLCTMSI
jgi:hypothetical protein